ncbi:hypothetical protein XarbCFBP8153_11215 [Xanthomonas arboricola]|nr:hypothetical protein XarbCFBP8153_11215 [Xanthomonas arboricola]
MRQAVRCCPQPRCTLTPPHRCAGQLCISGLPHANQRSVGPTGHRCAARAVLTVVQPIAQSSHAARHDSIDAPSRAVQDLHADARASACGRRLTA